MRNVGGLLLVAVWISRLALCADPQHENAAQTAQRGSESGSALSSYRDKLAQCSGDAFASQFVSLLDAYRESPSSSAREQLRKILQTKKERGSQNAELQKLEGAFLESLEGASSEDKSTGNEKFQNLVSGVEATLKDPKAGTCPPKVADINNNLPPQLNSPANFNPTLDQKTTPEALKDIKGLAQTLEKKGAAPKEPGPEAFERPAPKKDSGLDIASLLAGLRPPTDKDKDGKKESKGGESSGSSNTPQLPTNLNGNQSSKEDKPTPPSRSDHNDRRKNTQQDNSGGNQQQNNGNNNNNNSSAPKKEEKPQSSGGSSERSRPEPSPDPKAKERAQQMKEMNEEMQKQFQMQKEAQAAKMLADAQKPVFRNKTKNSIRNARTSTPRPIKSQVKPAKSSGGLQVKG